MISKMNQKEEGTSIITGFLFCPSNKVTSELLFHYEHGKSTEWATSYAFIYLLHVLAVCISHHQVESQLH
jgi:hypothetical protein